MASEECSSTTAKRSPRRTRCSSVSALGPAGAAFGASSTGGRWKPTAGSDSTMRGLRFSFFGAFDELLADLLRVPELRWLRLVSVLGFVPDFGSLGMTASVVRA